MFQTNIYKYILLRIRARPACDQPLDPNGDRVAHRTDNSVVTLLGQLPETSHGRGFDPTTSQSADYPCGIGSIAQRRYTYRNPHGYSAEGKYLASGRRRTRTVYAVCSGCRDNRAELSPTWTDPINYPGSKNPLRTSYVKQDGESIKRKGDEAKREQFTSRFNGT